MRRSAPSDFVISLPDVGDFTFGRRTLGDMLKIRTEYLSVVGSDDVNDPDLVVFGGLVAAYRVLIVSFPEGWGDLAALDMAIRPDLPSKLLELDSLLRDKEDSFRVKAEGGSTA